MITKRDEVFSQRGRCKAYNLTITRKVGKAVVCWVETFSSCHALAVRIDECKRDGYKVQTA